MPTEEQTNPADVQKESEPVLTPIGQTNPTDVQKEGEPAPTPSGQTNPADVQKVGEPNILPLEYSTKQSRPRNYSLLIDILVLAAVVTYVYLSYTGHPAATYSSKPQTASNPIPQPKPTTEMSPCKDLRCVEQKLAADPTLGPKACLGVDDAMVSKCNLVYVWRVMKKIPPTEVCDHFLDEEVKRICKNVTSKQNG